MQAEIDEKVFDIRTSRISRQLVGVASVRQSRCGW